MTLYRVNGVDYYSIKEAKQVMKQTGKRGFMTKIYSNGDWVNCGEINLNSSNKCHIEGDRHCNSY